MKGMSREPDPRRSRICIGAPWTFNVPGTVVRVVKSISETSECVPVNLDIKVDFAKRF